MAGRKKKPLALQQGNLTKEQIEQKQAEEEVLKDLSKEIKCPTWIKNKVAKSEFKRIAAELMKIGVITSLDINSLANYCVAFSKYKEAVEAMEGQPLVVEHTARNGNINLVENPLIKIQLKYSDEMKKLASELGLTINSRLKIASAKVEKEKEEDPLLSILNGDEDDE